MRELASVATVKGEEVEYGTWKKAFRICNDTVELIVLTEVGPRDSLLWFSGRRQRVPRGFRTAPADRVDRQFRVYGGHRLWVSPEVARTYYPDNFPVSVRKQGERVCFCRASGIRTPPAQTCRKELEIEAGGNGSTRLPSRIASATLDRHPTEMAPWALSVMAGGGRGHPPIPP
jgi:hypothetical protein